jgi:hypothetical protein
MEIGAALKPGSKEVDESQLPRLTSHEAHSRPDFSRAT